MESTLVQLVRLYEDFKAVAKDRDGTDNVAAFLSYAQGKIHTSSDYSEEINTKNWKKFNRKTLLEMATAYIGKMGRYIDNYGRKNLPDTPIGSIDEFTYLIVLLEHTEISKSELIQYNGHAITTGTDIIKRLLKKGFVIQKANPEDKRSYLIELTEMGKGALFQSSGTVNKLSVIAAGILSNDELIQLVGMLQKLDKFHDKVHQENKDLRIAEIIEEFQGELKM